MSTDLSVGPWLVDITIGRENLSPCEMRKVARLLLDSGVSITRHVAFRGDDHGDSPGTMAAALHASELVLGMARALFDASEEPEPTA